MSKIRVLVVDDSVVVRRIVSDALTADPDLEVVGTAANGKIGHTKVAQLKPDVVTLDVEMPEMDGLETLDAIRKVHPKLPVIMFSTLTIRGGETTLDALAHGASDYVTKPSNVGSVGAAQLSLRDQLIPKIKALCGKPVFAPTTAQARATGVDVASPVARKAVGSLPVDMVAIGVSTGGPNALSKLLPTIPADFPVPIVIVQHMPPMFTKLLAERLDVQSAIEVHEATEGQQILPQEAPENSCRPAVDVLFRSVVNVYGAGTLGVILTGMGQDGLRGCEQIREVGGQVFAQDEASSVVWGMPGSVSRAGLAHQILPLDQIGPEIVRRVKNRSANSDGQKVKSRP
jgi:two-component system chemotaxis response regulator CheB